jgi:hypothetical protein
VSTVTGILSDMSDDPSFGVAKVKASRATGGDMGFWGRRCKLLG